MFSIGEFSKISGLTVKALRFYHEQGLLVPSHVDEASGYRYYARHQIEAARAIAFLRGLDFPLSDIKEILHDASDEDRSLGLIERHRDAIRQKVKQLRQTLRSLDQFIAQETEARTMTHTTFEVQEKVLEPLLVGGIRMRGRYSDCGQGFSKIGRALGRYVCGKPLLLQYDAEYHENDADFEACLPLRQPKQAAGIAVRELPGGRCVSLLHKGPYEQLGRSYAKLLEYLNARGYTAILPTREIYLKCPGMIFKGNPKNYLTEIQMLVTSEKPGG